MIIFEDDPQTSSSRLLKSILHDNVDFAGSNHNLPRKIEEYIVQNKIYVFVDVVPDNPYLITLFKDLVNQYVDRKNITFFRIPCIEYFIILTMQWFGVTRKTEKLQDLFKILRGECVNYTNKTFEKFCKDVLGEQGICTANRRVSDDVFCEHTINKGRFYSGDCICQKAMPQCVTEVSQYDKALAVCKFVTQTDTSSATATEYLQFLANNAQAIQQNLDNLYSRLSNTLLRD